MKNENFQPGDRFTARIMSEPAAEYEVIARDRDHEGDLTYVCENTADRDDVRGVYPRQIIKSTPSTK